MSSSYKVSYVGDGTTTNYAVVPDYIRKNHIFVTLDGVATTAYTFFNDQTIQFNTAPGVGVVIEIVRRPPLDVPLNTFTGTVITPTALNENFRQSTQLGTIFQDDAENAVTTSQAAVVTANAAAATANATANTANQALNDSAFAVSTANAADVKADTAIIDSAAAVVTANQADINASAAVVTANQAEATANGIAATANLALSNSNDAVNTANGIAATANLALSNSNTAISTANTADGNASNAVTTSNNAIILASQAISLGQKAFIDLYNLAVGLPGSKIIDLGDLTSGCSSDYFTGEDGGTTNYNCAIGCSLTDLGAV